jgi:hypothetical protein
MNEQFILMIMGGVFILLGLLALFRGGSEEESYYDSLTTRPDLREYLEHQPERPEAGALKIGGWIAVAVGLFLLIMGGSLWFWG